ncbi:MAG: type IV toxin-antitoxin system AbiEi family antitoxin [Bryobacteraceae bacterium]
MYARQPIRRPVSALRLRAEQDRNVEVLDRFWNFPAEIEPPDLVPTILVYAALVASGNGRNVEAARLICEQRIGPAFKAFAAIAEDLLHIFRAVDHVAAGLDMPFLLAGAAAPAASVALSRPEHRTGLLTVSRQCWFRLRSHAAAKELKCA